MLLYSSCISTIWLLLSVVISHDGVTINVNAYHVVLPTQIATTTSTRQRSCSLSSLLYSVKDTVNGEKRYSGSDGTGVGWIDPSAPVNSKAALQKTIQKSFEGMDFQKHISLLGSTGSIGTQTLEIVDACPENFVIDALSAGTNVELLSQQILKYTPKMASVATSEAAIALKQGAGRLIRDESDRGVLAICDPRLASKAYGRTILASLPPMRRSRSEAEAVDFLESIVACVD